MGVAGRDGNRRVTGKEQFYTPRTLAKEVVAEILDVVPGSAGRTWLEPAAGSGSFLDAARDHGIADVVGLDLFPRDPRVEEADFLTVPLGHLAGAVTFGNPPFGRNNALSVPFFNRAVPVSDYIAFIVPRSWRKWSVQNRLDLGFHLRHDRDLTVDYVDEQGRDVYAKNTLRTCLQVWERRSTRRGVVRVLDRGVVQKTTPREADVALTLFGYGCGTVTPHFSRARKVSTQMYLRLLHPDALTALKSVDFSRFSRNVAYTEALALPEINYLLNEHLFGDPGLEQQEEPTHPGLF